MFWDRFGIAYYTHHALLEWFSKRGRFSPLSFNQPRLMQMIKHPTQIQKTMFFPARIMLHIVSIVHSSTYPTFPRCVTCLDCGFLLREGSKELDAMRLSQAQLLALGPLLWQSPKRWKKQFPTVLVGIYFSTFFLESCYTLESQTYFNGYCFCKSARLRGKPTVFCDCFLHLNLQNVGEQPSSSHTILVIWVSVSSPQYPVVHPQIAGEFGCSSS